MRCQRKCRRSLDTSYGLSKYEYIMIGPTISSAKFKEISQKAAYFFIILNQPQDQAEAMAELLKDVGAKVDRTRIGGGSVRP